MRKTAIRIATRKSPLALYQANFVKEALQNAYPEMIIELLPLITEGDRLLTTPLAKIGGKGLFIKELEKALLTRQADIAVHSIKDMPAELVDDFCLGAVCKREQPYDALLAKDALTLSELPEGAVVGTSSLRRQSQLKFLRPDLKMKNLRGNLNTRLKKFEEGEFDAIVLAAAGLERLNLLHKATQIMSPDMMLPAIGQGAIGIECHYDNQQALECIRILEDAPTRHCIAAERAVSFYLGGSCQLPIAAYAELQGDEILLRALVAEKDGSVMLRAEKKGNCLEPELIGKEVAENLLKQGAMDILK